MYGTIPMPKPCATSPATTWSSAVSYAILGSAPMRVKSSSTTWRMPERFEKNTCLKGRVSAKSTLCRFAKG